MDYKTIRLARAACFFTAFAVPSLLSAQDVLKQEVAKALPPQGEVTFNSVLALDQTPGAQPQLRHGEVARTADWPAVLYATFKTDRGTAACTAALLGPRALLTAAHCVPTSGVVGFKFANAPFLSDCERHPRYAAAADVSADYALCKVRPAPGFPNGVKLPDGARFERVTTDPMDSFVSQPAADPRLVTLTGFGCVSDIVRETTTDGSFRVGRTYFVESSNSVQKRREAARYAPSELNNLITVDDTEYANICPGDSGGPAYTYRADRREIIGVNSRVFYKDASRSTYGASLVSATGGPDFRVWALGWAEKRAKVAACGLSGDERCP